MSDRHIEKFYDELLCKDVKTLAELLTSITGSYRLLVGAAEEFNRIALVHRHEAEEAIERAGDLGDIIDDVEEELKKLMKLYLKELDCKIEYQELYNCRASTVEHPKQISQESLEDLKDK